MTKRDNEKPLTGNKQYDESVQPPWWMRPIAFLLALIGL